jgi:hypothetical protein
MTPQSRMHAARLNRIAGPALIDRHIMPRLVSTKTSADAATTAEKAADMIREDHGE